MRWRRRRGADDDTGALRRSGRFDGLEVVNRSGPVAVEDAIFEGCTFSNLTGRGGLARRVSVHGCRTWACSLHDVVLDECSVRDLTTRVDGSGGRSAPLRLHGVLARRTVVAGTIGGVIWDPPSPPPGEPVDRDPTAAQAFYAEVDWALDVSEARFRSVPTFRWGPPGHLIRRDPVTQPLVTRRRAGNALADTGTDSGVWWVVLDDLVRNPWPEELVLMPPLGAAKRRYEQDLAGLAVLEAAGAFDDDPLRP